MALKKQNEDFERALARLKESYRYYEFFRDSAIQRFESTVEIMWKALKGYLEEMEGVAEDIFKRLGLYISLFDKVLNTMEENLSL